MNTTHTLQAAPGILGADCHVRINYRYDACSLIFDRF